MASEDTQIVGKAVKDMYGTPMGKVIGTITDIDGSIQTVGVDCGSQGLQQVPFDQIVAQGSVVIFIPKWRLDSQRLLREKGLTLRRLKALSEILSENDEMRDDAAIVDGKYREQLERFDRTEAGIAKTLSARVGELDAQLRSVKMIVFDARVQYKSDEIPEAAFEAVRAHTSDLVEHITHENAEISSVQRRIADLNMEVRQVLEAHDARLQDSAETYLGDHTVTAAANLPEAPMQAPVPDGAAPAPVAAQAQPEVSAGADAAAAAGTGMQFPEPPAEIAVAAPAGAGMAPQQVAEVQGEAGPYAVPPPPPPPAVQPAVQPADAADAVRQADGAPAQEGAAVPDAVRDPETEPQRQQQQYAPPKQDWLARMQSQ